MKINIEASVIEDLLRHYVKYKNDIILDLEESEFLEDLLKTDYEHTITITFNKIEYSYLNYIKDCLEELDGKS